MTGEAFLWLSKISACLVSSPPLQGKHAFFNSVISSYLKRKKPVLFISTDHLVEDIKKAWLDAKFFYGDYEKQGLLKFIDCYSQHTGRQPKANQSVTYVAGPLALNELSIALAESEAEFYKKYGEHLIVFDSLSTLLLYSNPVTVARFTQVIIGKIRNASGKVCFSLEDGMHNSEVIVTVQHLVDAVVHVKRENSKVLYRADGIAELDKWKVL